MDTNLRASLEAKDDLELALHLFAIESRTDALADALKQLSLDATETNSVALRRWAPAGLLDLAEDRYAEALDA